MKACTLPLREATRLLFNRCSGLLLVRALLQNEGLTPKQMDFIGRNIAKAGLALGDALLVAAGTYHWSVVERGRRAQEEISDSKLPAPVKTESERRSAEPEAGEHRGFDNVVGARCGINLKKVRRCHAIGVEFKLHPIRTHGSREELATQYQEVSALASDLWLWLENRRLDRSFGSIRDYALSPVDKCPETQAWRNWLCNIRTFGPAAALDGMGARYPRERLFNSLPLLLWNGEVEGETEVQCHLRKQLRSRAADWNGFVAAYKKNWPPYG